MVPVPVDAERGWSLHFNPPRRIIPGDRDGYVRGGGLAPVEPGFENGCNRRPGNDFSAAGFGTRSLCP